jgi:hypothetical protein
LASERPTLGVTASSDPIMLFRLASPSTLGRPMNMPSDSLRVEFAEPVPVVLVMAP